WAWPNLLAKNPLLGKTFACMVALYFGLFLVLHVKTRFFLPFVPLLLLKMGLDWRLPKKNQRIPLFVGGLILVWISIHGPFS
ncbi:MAG: hypothetical protein KDC71_18295, partial [Acidobacteria bacterium]|nr:hypothetical protein [Acidobacteriota bacterium]